MAVPGLGTMVRYHASTGVDIPALVCITGTHWNDDLSTYYGNDGPGSGEVFLVTFNTDTGASTGLVYNVSEGTSTGQFSLIATEAEDS